MYDQRIYSFGAARRSRAVPGAGAQWDGGGGGWVRTVSGLSPMTTTLFGLNLHQKYMLCLKLDARMSVPHDYYFFRLSHYSDTPLPPLHCAGAPGAREEKPKEKGNEERRISGAKEGRGKKEKGKDCVD